MLLICCERESLPGFVDVCLITTASLSRKEWILSRLFSYLSQKCALRPLQHFGEVYIDGTYLKLVIGTVAGPSIYYHTGSRGALSDRS